GFQIDLRRYPPAPIQQNHWRRRQAVFVPVRGRSSLEAASRWQESDIRCPQGNGIPEHAKKTPEQLAQPKKVQLGRWSLGATAAKSHAGLNVSWQRHRTLWNTASLIRRPRLEEEDQ